MQSEVHFLGRLSHPNLVKLLGYCWEDKDLLLVYEFMPRGSLENHLFRSKFTIVHNYIHYFIEGTYIFVYLLLYIYGV